MALLNMASPARAQPATAEPAAYGALIDQAFTEYEAGNFPEARALFAQANALYSNARVLRGLGMVEFELRNYRDSASWLRQALSASEQPLAAALRNETHQLLDRANRFIVRLVLSVAPQDTEIRVDGVPAQLDAEGVLLLEVGDHTLLFAAPGYATEKRVLKGPRGDEQRWDVTLSPLPAPRAEQSFTTPVDPPEPPPSVAERRPLWFVVPRFTLVMPGSGANHSSLDCSTSTCPPKPEHAKDEYSRNASVMLGADLSFALSSEVRVGLGLHVQLNQTSWDFGNGAASFEAGRAYWLPASAEYRLPLNERLLLPMRLQAGLALMQAGRDMKANSDAAHSLCERIADGGVSCSVKGTPAAGVVLAVGPGLAYQVGKVALRADLSFGFQWLRILTLDRSAPGLSSTEKFTDGTFIAALSLAAEI